MIKVEINLCEDNNGLCSPCLLITEDNSEDRCPMILPERMSKNDAVELSEAYREIIESKYETVAEFRRLIYG